MTITAVRNGTRLTAGSVYADDHMTDDQLRETIAKLEGDIDTARARLAGYNLILAQRAREQAAADLRLEEAAKAAFDARQAFVTTVPSQRFWWEELSPGEQAAWRAVARAVLDLEEAP